MDIAVLVSGSGTNLQALIDSPELAGRIRVVISDRPSARALERARLAGIPTSVVPFEDYESRDAFSIAVAEAVADSGAGLMVLAGYMRILAAPAIDRFRNRIINIHPSLLPAFPGAAAVKQALDHGVKLTGVTVHFVDEGVDTGPIIAQVPVPVLPDDDVESLHARIQAEEHALLPRVVAELLSATVDSGVR